jgi:hypothetical protein
VVDSYFVDNYFVRLAIVVGEDHHVYLFKQDEQIFRRFVLLVIYSIPLVK